MSQIPPRGRLAPSPTGRIHLGNAFAFLIAWMHARASGGSLVLRMEDIDPARSKPEFVEGILEDLAWLGIDWDEGPDRGGPFAPYTQSLRLGRYAEVLGDLRERGLVYPCFCTRKDLRTLASAPHIGDEGVPYPGTCRGLSPTERKTRLAAGARASWRLDVAAALGSLEQSNFEKLLCSGGRANGLRPALVRDMVSFRHQCGCRTTSAALFLAGSFGSPSAIWFHKHFQNENASEGAGRDLTFIDVLRGRLPADPSTCGGDFALMRSDGVFAYQLAVSVDDADMGITQVVRGEDLLPSTPRQTLLLRLLGADIPEFLHVPLICDHFGERLAKRHRALEVRELREAGIASRAVVGYVGFLAGCLPEPMPREAKELVPLFRAETLAGRAPRLPENIAEVLKTL